MNRFDFEDHDRGWNPNDTVNYFSDGVISNLATIPFRPTIKRSAETFATHPLPLLPSAQIRSSRVKASLKLFIYLYMLYIFWINSWYKDCFRNERHKRFEEEYPIMRYIFKNCNAFIRIWSKQVSSIRGINDDDWEPVENGIRFDEMENKRKM